MKSLLKVCYVCKKEYKIFACWDIKVVGGSKTCSVECSNILQGTRKKKIKNCKFCKSKFSVRICEDTKFETCEDTKCRRENKLGVNNPNFRHGKFTEGNDVVRPTTKKYKEWRIAIFERDNYTCQMCEHRGGDIEADHIKPWAYYPKLRYILSNGRTLCTKCHRTTFKDTFKHRKTK